MTSTSSSLTLPCAAMSEPPEWALASGLPSRHIVRAAMHVAAVIDAKGSRVSDAHESYWHRATGGYHPPGDLSVGQRLLTDLGLLIDDRGVLTPTAELTDLLAGTVDDAIADIIARALTTGRSRSRIDEGALIDLIPDADQRERLLLQLARRHDDALRTAIGAAGEQLVVATARAELQELDRPDLARAVRRVSTVSDQLGYDVVAPCIQGPPRRLEVKATTQPSDAVVDVFLTRNEARVAEADNEWKLVVCLISDVERAAGEVIGWWSYADFAEYLPLDVNGGVWQQATITLAIDGSRAGLPSAIV